MMKTFIVGDSETFLPSDRMLALAKPIPSHPHVPYLQCTHHRF